MFFAQGPRCSALAVINPSTTSRNLLSVTNPQWEPFVPRKRWMMTHGSCFSVLARKARTATCRRANAPKQGRVLSNRRRSTAGAGARRWHRWTAGEVLDSRGGGGGGDCRSSSGARIPRKEAAPCAEGTLDGTGQSQKRRYARGRCLDIYDDMIKNTKHPDNPPSLWDEATEDKLCTQKTVNRYAGYLTDPVNGHKTPTGGTLAIGTATDYLQDFLQALNARFIT